MPSLPISLLSSLISLQNRQKCRFEPTLKKCRRNKASRAKKPYFMRLTAQTRRPETDTKRPEVDTLTKRLEISLGAIPQGFESLPLRQKTRLSRSKSRKDFLAAFVFENMEGGTYELFKL